VPGGITGPACHRGDIKGPDAPGWRLNARLMNLVCEEIVVAKPEKVKTGSNLAESSKEGYVSKRAVLPMMIKMMMML
jgi:hypothetical protein